MIMEYNKKKKCVVAFCHFLFKKKFVVVIIVYF